MNRCQVCGDRRICPSCPPFELTWYEDKPALRIARRGSLQAVAVVADVTWHYRNGQWHSVGERVA